MIARPLAALALVALFAGCLLLAPSGSLAELGGAAPFLAPSAAHPFGTDDLGRDVLAAVAQGGRTSLAVATATAAIALLLGTAIGIGAALGGRTADAVLMRATDIVASLPALPIALLVASLLGPSPALLVGVLGLTRWPVLARIARATAVQVRRREHYRAAQALGGTAFWIARRHVLPAVLPAVLAGGSIVFGGAILAEAALGFVGLADPDHPSWGQLVAASFAHVDHAWWCWAAPASAIALAAALVALIADEA